MRFPPLAPVAALLLPLSIALTIALTFPFAFSISRAEESPRPQATPLSSRIGVPNMEGGYSDLAGNFYFVNMRTDDYDAARNGNIGVLRPGQTEPEVFVELPEGMRGNGLVVGPNNTLYVADQLGGSVFKIDIPTREITTLYTFEIEEPNWTNTPNDVAITPDASRLYISRMAEGLWTITLEGEDVRQVSTQYTNGVEVSADGTTLYTQHGFYRIQPDGNLEHTGIRARAPGQGFAYMDGMRADAEGNLYIARAGAREEIDGQPVQHNGGVHIIAPDGSHIKTIEVPHSRAHNLGFGGPEGKTLFIICPGNDGFIAVWENDIPGAYLQVLQAWENQ